MAANRSCPARRMVILTCKGTGATRRSPRSNAHAGRAAMPWLGILFVFLILVTYVPWLSTFVPTLLMGPEIIIQ